MPAPSPDFISGLMISWTNYSTISVSAGAAAMPDTGQTLVVASPISVSGLAFANSVMFVHVYLYNNSGTPAIEVVTTAPDSPYAGLARAKSGDVTRRYLGSLLWNGSTTKLTSFVHTPGQMEYRTNIGTGAGTTLQPITNGRATSATSISCSAAVPVTTTHALGFQYNDPSTSTTVLTGCSDGALPPSQYEGFLAAGAQAACPIRLNSSQAFTYAYQSTPAGSSGYTVRIAGFKFTR